MPVQRNWQIDEASLDNDYLPEPPTPTSKA